MEAVVFPVGRLQLPSRCQPAPGEATFWLDMLQNRALALPRASPMVLQLRFCTANHKVLLTLGAKGCILTFFRAE